MLAPADSCTGCSACSSICPKQCISMEYDEEGFLYPKIVTEKCIDCGLCSKVCPILSSFDKNNIGEAYACINNDEEVLMESSSGGLFSLLAEQILQQKGVVFGAAFDDKYKVHHIAIESKENIQKLRGSKYVQSNVGETLKEVKECLEKGRKVLFSGTPCQIHGLLKFLGKQYDNLLTVDFICHGVPSPKAWEKYLKQRKEQYPGERIESIKFRDKSKGWGVYTTSIIFREHRYEKTGRENTYMKAFFGNWMLRYSCYNCGEKSMQRRSDITLADFWGIKNVVPEMYCSQGTSLLLINSEKGKRSAELIMSKMTAEKVNYIKAINQNPGAFRAAEKPQLRKFFMRDLDKKSFDAVVKKYYLFTFVKKCIRKIKQKVNILLKSNRQ